MFDSEQVAQLSIAELSQKQNGLVDGGDLAGAESLLRAWLTEHAGDEGHIPRLELARVLFWKGKLIEAKECLEIAFDEVPDDTWALSFLGQVEAKLGNYVRARVLFSEALSIYPDNHEALTFLEGNPLDKLATVKKLLTRGRLSCRNRIKVGELFSALDFSRGVKLDFESGEITQESFDRFNLTLDQAEVGLEVDSPISLRDRFLAADEIIFFTTHAFGDAILGLGLLQGIIEFFEINPKELKPVEIVTPFADVFEGLAEAHDYISVKKICAARDPERGNIAADYLRRKTDKVFVITNAPRDSMKAAAEVSDEHENVIAFVDSHVERIALDVSAWQMSIQPYHRITALPARLFRFFEMLVGQKLTADPTRIKVQLPLPRRVRERQSELYRKYGLEPLNYHVVVESASVKAKEISHNQCPSILEGIAHHCALEEATSGRRMRKIAFSKDPYTADSFANKLLSLSEQVRARTVVVSESLASIAALIARANTILSPDTGIAHLAGALNKETLIIYTVADPHLWHTGGQNVETLASRRAQSAHYNATPVNMLEWSGGNSLTEEEFDVHDILHAWRKVADRESLKNQQPTAEEQSNHHPSHHPKISFLSVFDRTYYQSLGARRDTLRKVFELLESKNKRFYTIIETGTANLLSNGVSPTPEDFSAHGHSTILFDRFVNHYDGVVYSVDINPLHCEVSRMMVSGKTQVICQDSVSFLWHLERYNEIDCIYLDSFDIDWKNPHPSAFHHMKEFCAILPKLRDGCILFIDDNANGEGKGNYVRDFMKNIGAKSIFDSYQAGWVLTNNGAAFG